MALPAPLSPSRLSARVWLSLAAAVGCGALGYAGLYPRFDDGSMRIILALTSAPFAAAVISASVSAKTPARATGVAFLFSSILGIASTIIPAAVLTYEKPGEFFFAVFFGGFFGAPTGALYGIPLGILAMLGQGYVRAKTHDATDRAARAGGFWLLAIGALALATTFTLDRPQMDWATDTMKAPSRIPAYVAMGVLAAGVACMMHATRRVAQRRTWLTRVRAGEVPKFRVRAADPRDQIEGLPRLGEIATVPDFAEPTHEILEGVTVLEWLPDEVTVASAGTAYRVTAAGRAVAVVRGEHGGDGGGGGEGASRS